MLSLFVMQADDRLLQISDNMVMAGEFSYEPGMPSDAPASATDLTVHHLKPPPQYVSANWPLQHAALSPDGVDIAVAGRKGLALYSRRSARWRLFGDVSQEKELTVHVRRPPRKTDPCSPWNSCAHRSATSPLMPAQSSFVSQPSAQWGRPV